MIYVGSEDGQAASQASSGSAPISGEMRDQMLQVIDQITVAS
jgi:hypothetical protein